MLPTVKARDSQAEGYEAGLRRSQPQIGTIAKGIADGDERITDDGLLRTPSVTDSTGGAISETQARERGRMVKVADQAAQLAFENGLRVSPSIAESLLPTPAVGHIRNYDEPVEDYLDRRAKAESGEYRGMPGVSLGVAVRMEMLPTPQTMDTLPARSPEKLAESKLRSPAGYSNLRETVVNDLMFTPKALDGVKGNLKTSQERIDSGRQIDLTNVVNDLAQDLLPTTTASDWKGANHSGSGSASSRGISTVVEQTTSWGKFEPAIRRWEAVLGRPAPAPTKPDGKDGSHRLSSRFTEWMMGLPDGWITDSGLSRNEELKACGNGVVPQQAELALRILLQGVGL